MINLAQYASNKGSNDCNAANDRKHNHQQRRLLFQKGRMYGETHRTAKKLDSTRCTDLPTVIEKVCEFVSRCVRLRERERKRGGLKSMHVSKVIGEPWST